MKNLKVIPKDKYRVIKISKDALFEFIYESIIDCQQDFFDVTANKKGEVPIVTEFDINWATGEFIVIARNVLNENEHLAFNGIDCQALLKNMKDTTNTMFEDNRYVELTLDEIKNIQNQ